MAVLCRHVEPKPDGTVDVLGIIDGVVVEPQGEDALGLTPAARIALTALVSLKAGDARGLHTLGIRSAYPSGRPGASIERRIEFTDAMPAASLVVPLELDIHERGVYTFEAIYDGQALTRMTLWVGYR
jgi:hypothetical protein